MHLSEIGKIANDCWLAIPQHFPFVRLGEFVVMPNHVHGIVIIDKDVETQEAPPVETQAPPVETQDLASLPEDSQKNKFGPQSRNLASIIRGFKIGVTKSARSILPAFAWQPRYHDHIIRDTKSYDRISNYIINNPASWKEDKFY